MLKSLKKLLKTINFFLKQRLQSSLNFAVLFCGINVLVFSGYYVLFYETEILWLDAMMTILCLMVIGSAYSIVLKKNIYIFIGSYFLSPLNLMLPTCGYDLQKIS